VINFKTLAIAAAVSSAVVFALPASSQAMLQAAPVKIDAASSDTLVQVHYRKRYCRYGRCYGRYRYSRYRYRYPHYGHYRPYYGYYRPYHYRPYYGYYPYNGYYGRPYWGGWGGGPGIGLYFRF
jgi:hypothetical protein